MRILVDVRLLAGGETSGIQEYTVNLLQSLLARDDQNEYVFFYNGLRKKPLDSQLPISQCKKVVGIVDWRLPNKLLDFSLRFANFPAIDSFAAADVVFSPHFNILKTRETPRVITFHDLSFLHHPDFFSWRQRFWHWLQNYKKQAQEAARIIAVSEFTKSDLVNLLKLPEEKIAVIYSGISEKFRKLAPQDKELTAFQNRHNLHFPFLLYLGTLEPRKNIAAVVRAFNTLKCESRFRNFKLILAGRGGWLYQNILAEARRSSYAGDIIFWGKVGAEDRVFLYNLASVFVYPSFFEGFGFPPLEAQACGCPAVIADRTSLPEMAGGAAASVDPWRIDGLAAAIRQIIEDERYRTRLVQSGLENARKFNWSNTAAKTLEILHDV